MAKPKSNKTKLTLWVDKNIIELAKRKIGNLSAFFEIKVLEFVKLENGDGSAAARIRTWDHRLNRPTLYQLSYGGSDCL